MEGKAVAFLAVVVLNNSVMKRQGGQQRKWARWGGVGGAALLACCCAFALEPQTPLARLGRQAWTVDNGLPENTVMVLAQSRDGFVWAGTELGLARFDGVSFQIYDHAANPYFPDAEIRCVLDTRKADGSGALWVGTSDGLVQMEGGRTTLITTRNGLPGNAIRGLAQTANGDLWAWTEMGLARWRGPVSSQQPGQGAPQQFSAVTGNGLPRALESGVMNSIAADGAGGLWVGSSQGAAVLRGGTWQQLAEARTGQAMVATGGNGSVLVSAAEGVYESAAKDGALWLAIPRASLPVEGVSALAILADGQVAAAGKSAVVVAKFGKESRIIVRYDTGRALPGSRIETIYPDREGSLWVGSNHGLARISGAGVEQLPATDPLAANAVVALMEDREGDLWAGTETGGLQILRDAHFEAIGSAEGLSSDNTTAVVEDAAGGVWVGTRDAGLNHWVGGRVTGTATAASGLASNVILSLAASPAGYLWVGTPDGLTLLKDGRATNYTSADGLPDDFIRSLLVEPDGSVWIGTRRGLTHMLIGREGQHAFENFTQADGLGSNLVGALARTADGDLWIATLNGLSRLHEGKIRNYTTGDGLSSNVITTLEPTPDGKLWIGTQADGLNEWDGKRLRAIHGSGGDLARLPGAVHALVADGLGWLWMASDFGLARAPLAALEACAGGGECRLAVARYTTADGLRSRETSVNSHPTALRTRAGALWFATPRGVVVADPRHFAPLPAPPVAIERFAVDDREVDAHETPLLRIAAGHLRFQFDYAGLSFAAGPKLRYQYMLEGFDHGWTEAGARRTAYYTNIPPGKYRFRVRAALPDQGAQEVSEAPEADLAFQLLPHFYQTLWFGLVLLALAGAAVFFLFRRRVRLVERELRAVMAERNRIAREIHDTLAQGYVGVSMQLEVLGELLRHNRAELAQKHLALTQEQVREGLDDARRSIWALRSQDAGEQTLPIRLRRLVEKAETRSMAATLEVHGAYRALSPGTEKEILRIAQEAIHNVQKHAEATELAVRVEYDQRVLAVTITDNGKGFAAAEVGSDDHYGLTGMRERAALIAATIEITSSPGTGTQVRMEISAPPARKADEAEKEN